MEVTIECYFVFHSKPYSSGWRFFWVRQAGEATRSRSGRTQDVGMLAGGGLVTSQVRKEGQEDVAVFTVQQRRWGERGRRTGCGAPGGACAAWAAERAPRPRRARRPRMRSGACSCTRLNVLFLVAPLYWSSRVGCRCQCKRDFGKGSIEEERKHSDC